VAGQATDALRENPFFVLGVQADADARTLEREGQRLLGGLELGLQWATECTTPLGPLKRTPELVRWAIAELRDPTKRLRYEFWAQIPAPAAGTTSTAPHRTIWRRPFRALGFGRRTGGET